MAEFGDLLVQHEDLMVQASMFMVQAHMMVQGFVDENIIVQKTTDEIPGIKGYGYCLLPGIFPPDPAGAK